MKKKVRRILTSVVMIQCVGSRNEENENCSRICCQSAVKNALAIKKLNPDAAIYILYRDIRTYGLLEDYYKEAREKGIIFIRFDPGGAAGGKGVCGRTDGFRKRSYPAAKSGDQCRSGGAERRSGGRRYGSTEPYHEAEPQPGGIFH